MKFFKTIPDSARCITLTCIIVLVPIKINKCRLATFENPKNPVARIPFTRFIDERVRIYFLAPTRIKISLHYIVRVLIILYAAIHF